MKKAALFDMDGTLVDNTPAHIRAFEIFCDRYGVRNWKERLSQGFGMGNDDIMRLILPEEVIASRGLQALADEKEAIYREIYAPEIRPVAGLRDLLLRLRALGIRCAVGSSGCRANVDFVLERCGIAEFFDARISGDAVTRCKPDPEIYLKAAEALDVTPGECIVFEDAKAGIEAAAGPEPDASSRWPPPCRARRCLRRRMPTASSMTSRRSPTPTWPNTPHTENNPKTPYIQSCSADYLPSRCWSSPTPS